MAKMKFRPHLFVSVTAILTHVLEMLGLGLEPQKISIGQESDYKCG